MQTPLPDERLLHAGHTTVAFMPDICLVSAFTVGSWPVLYRAEQTGNVRRWGLPLMIPNFGRVKDGVFRDAGTALPMHGFGRDLPWTVTEQADSHATMRLESSPATETIYPYPFAFIVRLSAAEGQLTYEVTVENRGETAMPIAPGFHPYFSIDQANKAAIIGDGPPGFGASAFDWDNSPPDTPYTFPHHVALHIPGRGALTIDELPWRDRYSLTNMQVWSEHVSAPDHDFVCFEPTVGSQDAINRPADRIEIAPHNEHRILLRITAEPLAVAS